MLNNLEVVNGSISPEFRSDILEYQVMVDKEVLTLVLNYETSENATVTIYGNDYLTEGENHVIIEVYENELQTYTLNVFKEGSKLASNLLDTYEKVEIDAGNLPVKEYITPTISIICFLTIAFLFCIIFKKK